MSAKSRTIAILPLLIALEKFKEREITGFRGKTAEQKFLLSLLPHVHQVKYSTDEIKSYISDSAHVLNKALKENGFDIQLDERMPFDLGVVTIMDLIGKWLDTATAWEIRNNGKKYEAARFKVGTDFITTSRGPILQIRTESDLTVFIEPDVTGKNERSGIELFQHVYNLLSELNGNVTTCDAIIPLTVINDQPDITFMNGLAAVNTELYINQALQQNMLEINLCGIHAKSGTVLGAVRGIAPEKPLITIDTPFTMCIARSNRGGVYFPLMVAYVTPESWKEVK